MKWKARRITRTIEWMKTSQLLNARRMITNCAALAVVSSTAVKRRARAPAALPASQESASTSTSVSTIVTSAVIRATTPKAPTHARVLKAFGCRMMSRHATTLTSARTMMRSAEVVNVAIRTEAISVSAKMARRWMSMANAVSRTCVKGTMEGVPSKFSLFTLTRI